MKKLFVFFIIICFGLGLNMKKVDAYTLPVEGNTYSSFAEVTPYFNNNYPGEYSDFAYADWREVKSEYWWFWGSTHYKNIEDKVVAIYEIGKAEMPISSFVIGYLTEGSSISKTQTFTYQSTYEKSLETSLSSTISASATVGINYDMVSASSTISSSITAAVNAKVTETTSKTKSESLTINIPIKENAYYRLDQRATFMIYVVQIYEIQYTVTEKKVKSGWGYDTHYIYEQNKYKLLDSFVKYKYIANMGLSLVKCAMGNDGKLYFNDSRPNQNIMYF